MFPFFLFCQREEKRKEKNTYKEEVMEMQYIVVCPDFFGKKSYVSVFLMFGFLLIFFFNNKFFLSVQVLKGIQ